MVVDGPWIAVVGARFTTQGNAHVVLHRDAERVLGQGQGERRLQAAVYFDLDVRLLVATVHAVGLWLFLAIRLIASRFGRRDRGWRRWSEGRYSTAAFLYRRSD